MNRRILWVMVSAFTVLALVTAACGPTAPATPAAPVTPPTPVTSSASATTTTVPTAEKPQKEAVKPAPVAPKYGGVLTISLGSDIVDFDSSLVTAGSGVTNKLTNHELWAGDWAKGPAGGYGTNETGWEMSQIDLFDQKAGQIAESTTWTVDAGKNEGTIIYQIRRGLRYALNPASEASRLVNGRELNTDDVVFELKRVTSDQRTYIYKANPELRVAQINQTGPWEVKVTVPLAALVTAISRLSDSHTIYPKEVLEKYGGTMSNWRNSVGTGPFILKEHIPGSAASLVRNPAYFFKDPIGPGKGNQLPYLDGVRVLIIPDESTRFAAMRTGKIDQLAGIDWEDATQLMKTTSALLERSAGLIGVAKVTMTQDKPPFNDVRVRRAMMMAIDFEAINQSLYGGRAYVQTFPFRPESDAYKDLYLALDDPEFPESAKELYTYHPDKAKQLLKEAGYPSGFKTSMLLTSGKVDYMAILKDYWSKIGVEVALDVKERGVATTLSQNRAYDGLSAEGGQGPTAAFYIAMMLTGEGAANGGKINDPVVNKAIDEIRITAIKDLKKAMKQTKELTKYVVDQAFVIPDVSGPRLNLWWPWIGNYSGEESVGYYNAGNWPQWVWLDQEKKKSMGY